MIATETEAREFIGNLAEADEQGVTAKLETLALALNNENGRQNLVSKSSLEDIWVRHFADSAQLLNHVSRETTGTWLDLGSGAGFRLGRLYSQAQRKTDTDRIASEES